MPAAFLYRYLPFAGDRGTNGLPRSDFGSMVPADGCTDLIVRDGQLVVAGPSTRWIATRSDGDSGSVGVRLPPGFAGAVLGTSAVELVDRAAPIEDLVPYDATPELHSHAAGRAASAGAVAAELGESDNARHLLERGAKSSETAAAAGFADQAHLTREFRRLVGITPAQFAGSSA